MSKAKHVERAAGLRRFKPYPAYNDSGVDWMGEIPAHWEVRRLRSTVTSCQNGVWGDEPDGVHDVPCVRVADFDRVIFRVNMVDPTLRSIEQRMVKGRGLKPGDLLLEKSGGGENQPVGAVVTYDHDIPAVCSNFIARVTAAEGYDPRFLTYMHAALYALRINTRHIKQSTGIQNLDSASYLREATGFPDADEQRAIAAFLDRETAKIDALIAKKERVIELLQEKRASLTTCAVTKGLDPNVPMKVSGISSIGTMPAHWELKRLRYLTPDARPIMYGIVLPGPDVDDGVSIVKGGDVKPDRLQLELLNRTTFEIEAGYKRSRLKEGDIVYAIRGGIGDAELIPKEIEGANLTQDAARISPVAHVCRAWLLYCLKSRAIFQQLEAGALGATIRGINIRDLKRAVIPLPPQAEQVKVAEFLQAQTKRLDAFIDKVRGGIERLNEYRTALISAAVTGKIDVRSEVAAAVK